MPAEASSDGRASFGGSIGLTRSSSCALGTDGATGGAPSGRPASGRTPAATTAYENNRTPDKSAAFRLNIWPPSLATAIVVTLLHPGVWGITRIRANGPRV